MTRLGDKIQRVATPPTRTRLGEAVAGTGAIVYRDVTIPIAGGVRAKMRLLGHDEQMTATAALAERLRALRLEDDWLSKDTIEQERARQYLVIACRDPEDPIKPIGSTEDWANSAITSPVLIGLWIEYADMVATFDPAHVELTAEDLRDIPAAIEKKSVRSLVSFGSSKLANWLLSTGAPPAVSPIPMYSPESAPITTP